MSETEQHSARETLIEIVENQLEEGNPVKVKETLMRLRMTGMKRDEAIEYIACALSVEIMDVVNNQARFNLPRYSKNLDTLPGMPWADEE